MKDIKSLVDLIGNTPIVQAKNIDAGKCNLFLKMENMNPGSSIKDRVAPVSYTHLTLPTKRIV